MTITRKLLVENISAEHATATSDSGNAIVVGQMENLSSVYGFPVQEGIIPVLEGTPETLDAGDLAITTPGRIGSARFKFSPAQHSGFSLPNYVEQPPLFLGASVAKTGKGYEPRITELYDGSLLIMHTLQSQHPYYRYRVDFMSGQMSLEEDAQWLGQVQLCRKYPSEGDHKHTYSTASMRGMSFGVNPNAGGGTSYIGCLGLVHFPDTQETCVIGLSGSIVEGGALHVWSRVEDTEGSSFYPKSVRFLNRAGGDVERNYEDIIVTPVTTRTKDVDGSYTGDPVVLGGHESADRETYVIQIVREGPVGLPNDDEEDVATFRWTLRDSEGNFIGWRGDSDIRDLPPGNFVTLKRKGATPLVVPGMFPAVPLGALTVNIPNGVRTEGSFEPGDIIEITISEDGKTADLTAFPVGGRVGNLELFFSIQYRRDTIRGNTKIVMTALEAGSPLSKTGVKFLVTVQLEGAGDILSAVPMEAIPIWAGREISLTNGVRIMFPSDEGQGELEAGDFYTFTVDPRSYFHSGEAVRLPNDRVVYVVCTSTSVISFVSDDRCVSWRATTVYRWSWLKYVGGITVSLLSNGTICAVASVPKLGDPLPELFENGIDQAINNGFAESELVADGTREGHEIAPRGHLFLSSDGETWQGPLFLDPKQYGASFYHRVGELPNGRAILLSQVFANYSPEMEGNGTSSNEDEAPTDDFVARVTGYLHQRVSALDDLVPGSDLLRAFPAQGYFEKASWPFHTHGSDTGLVGTSNHERVLHWTGMTAGRFYGHGGGLCSVTWRGRLLIASTVMRDGKALLPNPSSLADDLFWENRESYEREAFPLFPSEPVTMLYKTAYFTNGCEVLSGKFEDLAYAQKDTFYRDYGRHYQLCWDHHYEPDDWWTSGAVGFEWEKITGGVFGVNLMELDEEWDDPPLFPGFTNTEYSKSGGGLLLLTDESKESTASIVTYTTHGLPNSFLKWGGVSQGNGTTPVKHFSPYKTVTRVVVHLARAALKDPLPNISGSLDHDACFVKCRLAYETSSGEFGTLAYGVGWTLRLFRVNNLLTFRIIDNTSGETIHQDAFDESIFDTYNTSGESYPNEMTFVEFLVATDPIPTVSVSEGAHGYSKGVADLSVAWRPLRDRDELDPFSFFTTVGKDEETQRLEGGNDIVSAVATAEYLSFGQSTAGVTSGIPVTLSIWKSVHFHRGLSPLLHETSPATVIPGIAPHNPYFPLVDARLMTRAFSLPGATNTASGVITLPQPAQVRHGSRYLMHGIKMRWIGYSQRDWTLYRYTPRYQYPAAHLLSQPLQLPYVSGDVSGPDEDMTSTVTVTFSSSERAVVKGFVVFNCNVPWLRFSMGSSIVTAGTSLSDLVTMSTDIWITDIPGVAGVNWTVDGNRIRFASPGGATPEWRPHQFYSHESGLKFYLCVEHVEIEENPINYEVYELRDNGTDWLETHKPLTFVSGNSGTALRRFSVYCNKFAIEMPTRVLGTSSSYTLTLMPKSAGGGQDAFVTYYESDSVPEDIRNRHRIGRFMLGEWLDISDPGVDWSWRTDVSSGYSLERSPSQAVFASRQGPPMRTLTCSVPNLLHDERGGVQFRDSRGGSVSWQGLLELARRTEQGGRVVALSWEADRIDEDDGAPEESDLLCARMSIAGFTHETYTGFVNAQGDCVARPVLKSDSIVFAEED